MSVNICFKCSPPSRIFASHLCWWNYSLNCACHGVNFLVLYSKSSSWWNWQNGNFQVGSLWNAPSWYRSRRNAMDLHTSLSNRHYETSLELVPIDLINLSFPLPVDKEETKTLTRNQWVCLGRVLFEIILVALFVMWRMWDKRMVETIKKKVD